MSHSPLSDIPDSSNQSPHHKPSAETAKESYYITKNHKQVTFDAVGIFCSPTNTHTKLFPSKPNTRQDLASGWANLQRQSIYSNQLVRGINFLWSALEWTLNGQYIHPWPHWLQTQTTMTLRPRLMETLQDVSTSETFFTKGRLSFDYTSIPRSNRGRSTITTPGQIHSNQALSESIKPPHFELNGPSCDWIPRSTRAWDREKEANCDSSTYSHIGISSRTTGVLINATVFHQSSLSHLIRNSQ